MSCIQSRSGKDKTSEFRAEFSQRFCGDAAVFCLEAFSMLFALMFDHGEIRTRLGAIQALAHFRQDEAAGLRTDSIDGNHNFMTKWLSIPQNQGQEIARMVQIIQDRGGTASEGNRLTGFARLRIICDYDGRKRK
jgi:hypothetical protein